MSYQNPEPDPSKKDYAVPPTDFDDLDDHQNEMWQQFYKKALEESSGDIDLSEPAKVETQLVNQIRRSNLSGEALKLATKGFIGALWALIRPFFGSEKDNKEDKGVSS